MLPLGLLLVALALRGQPARAEEERVRIDPDTLAPLPSGDWQSFREAHRRLRMGEVAGQGSYELAARLREKDAELADWLVVRALRRDLAADFAGLTGPETPGSVRGLVLARQIEALPAMHPARSALVRELVERRLGAPGRPTSRELERLLALVSGALQKDTDARRWPTLRLAHARLLEAKGEGALARHQRLTLLREAPASAEGLALSRAEPDLATALEPSAQVARLEALIAANLSALAIPEAYALRATGALEAGLACRLSLMLGKAHRLERNYREALEELEAFGERCPERADKVLEARWLRASASSIALGDPAIPLYAKFVKENPGDPRVDDALFFIADLHLLGGRDDAAARFLERVIREHPKGNFTLKSAWRLARRWLRVGKGGKAMVALRRYENLARRRKSSFDLRRARYFQARTLLSRAASKGKPVAVRLLTEVIDDGPLTFYGSLARGLLREHAPGKAKALEAKLLLAPQPPASFPAQQVSPAFLARPPIRVARRLLALDLKDEAREVLAGIQRRSLKTEGEVLTTAALLDRAGGVREAQLLLRATRIGRGAMGKRPVAKNLWVWQVAYPRAYRQLIVAACEPVEVPPDLVQAIIREESALDPTARSWAGAVGLAQLMPTTAGDTGRRMGLKAPITAERLLDPALNLRVSCRYLSDLRRQVGEKLPLMIAAYNGGARSVQGWQELRGELPLELFLETMGYAETRRYSRRVLKTLAVYRFLYGEEEERLFLLSDPARTP